MKRNLRAIFYGCVFGCLLSGTAQAQIKGNPQLRSVAPQTVLDKSPSKLNGDLKALAKDASGIHPMLAQRPISDSLARLMHLKGDKIVVDITVQGNVDKARAELEKKGLQVTGVYGRTVSGVIRVNALSNLESAASVRFVQPAYSASHHAAPAPPGVETAQGSLPTPVISQGDTAQRSYIARKKYKVNGNGVKVGILSDSYNSLGTAGIGVKHGELPGTGNPFGFTKPVQVLVDDASGADEGRGMAEIVHDVAPGAELAFSTAYDGQAAFAQNIVKLSDAGCNVINDDVYYFAEPFFQDGIIAQAVDKVKKRGVTYFSAAGNQSVRSYESEYRQSTFAPFGTANGTAHNFSAPGAQPRYFQPIYVPTNGSFLLSFQWDQPFYSAGGAGSQSDLDIYLLDANGKVVGGSASDNIKSGDPLEIFSFQNTTSSNTFYLAILQYAGPDPTHLKYVLYGSAAFYLTSPAIPGILAPTLVGHAKAAGAIAVAAAPWYETPAYGVDTAQVEYFSSVGGVPNFFNTRGERVKETVRRKPEITAPDGGNTSFFPPASLFGNQDIPQDKDNYPNFFGTSAATPHAAGVAALMIEAQKLKTITPDQIKGLLTAHALDMDNIYTDGFDKGFDFNTGFGLIQADASVADVVYPNIFVKDLKLEPACSDNPALVLNWKVHNPNPFPVYMNWYLIGFPQYGGLSVPGHTTITFTTRTASYGGYPIPNVVLINWQDNMGIPHFDVKSSSSATCSNLVTAPTLQQKANVDLNKEKLVTSLEANVYPNPSSGNFKLRLSGGTAAKSDLELYSTDGKLLLKKQVYANGTFDIDASRYAPGMYMLRIQQDGVTKTLRLVKQ